MSRWDHQVRIAWPLLIIRDKGDNIGRGSAINREYQNVPVLSKLHKEERGDEE